jgi:hypothetical protein
MNFQAYEYFLICLTKFTWIWNPNSDSWFEFKCLNQIHSITKFGQNLVEFKSKPNMIWIPIRIILRKNEKSVLCRRATLEPMATVAHWAKANLAGPDRRPVRTSAWLPRSGSRLGAALNGVVKHHWRWGLRQGHHHYSGYTSLHQDLDKVAEKGVLTGEAVGVAATNGVEGGNGSQVGEGAPNSAS